MIRIHSAPLTRSLRILWLLEEMGLEYETVTATVEDLRKPDFLRKSPLGLLPLLEDGDTVVFESAAIAEYLLDTYGDRGLRPANGTPERARYMSWLSAAETIVLPLGQILPHVIEMEGFEPEGGHRDPRIAEAWRPRHDRYLAAVEQELSDREYIAGDSFSAADIMLFYGLAGARMFQMLDEKRVPNVVAYLARLAARPAAAKIMPV